MARLRYSPKFRRTELLEDGTRATVRLVQPTDKAFFRRGIGRLSPQSRYRRFLTHRDSFNDSELTYLTELDGWNHLALGALVGGEGAGVARFIRLPDDPGAAEAAIAILDEHHGKGLGKILLDHLAAAARERGISRFRCDVLAENVPMLALLRRLSPGAEEKMSGAGVMQVDVPLA
jgi:GNAT superfamily N-acetyltransferase